MNRTSNFNREKPENSSMTTVNILGRLRMAKEQVQRVKLSLSNDGTLHSVPRIQIADFSLRHARTRRNLG